MAGDGRTGLLDPFFPHRKNALQQNILISSTAIAPYRTADQQLHTGHVRSLSDKGTIETIMGHIDI